MQMRFILAMRLIGDVRRLQLIYGHVMPYGTFHLG
jgi:hypothetical protein